MIIDFHTHTFPEKIAEKAIRKLSLSGDTKNYTDGQKNSLSDSMRSAGIDYSVILPVATSPSQYETINRVACEVNETSSETGLISFGGIHPDNENYREILCSVQSRGIKGIKLHPAYQNVDIDDIRFLRIIDCACELGLIVVTHAGYDVSYPTCTNVLPEKLLHVINELHPPKFVLAHMGGWGCCDDVFHFLAGQNVYFDTSFSITPIINAAGTALSAQNDRQLPVDKFVRLVRAHGADKILFGSDSPWSSQSESLTMLKNSGLRDDELELILGKNAENLLASQLKRPLV